MERKINKGEKRGNKDKKSGIKEKTSGIKERREEERLCYAPSGVGGSRFLGRKRLVHRD